MSPLRLSLLAQSIASLVRAGVPLPLAAATAAHELGLDMM